MYKGQRCSKDVAVNDTSIGTSGSSVFFGEGRPKMVGTSAPYEHWRIIAGHMQQCLKYISMVQVLLLASLSVTLLHCHRRDNICALHCKTPLMSLLVYGICTMMRNRFDATSRHMLAPSIVCYALTCGTYFDFHLKVPAAHCNTVSSCCLHFETTETLNSTGAI